MDLNSDQTPLAGEPMGSSSEFPTDGRIRANPVETAPADVTQNPNPASSSLQVPGDVPWAIQSFKLSKHLLPCLRELDRTNGMICTLRRREMSPPPRCVIKTVTVFGINWAGPCFFISQPCVSDIFCQSALRSPFQMAQNVLMCWGLADAS